MSKADPPDCVLLSEAEGVPWANSSPFQELPKNVWSAVVNALVSDGEGTSGHLWDGGNTSDHHTRRSRTPAPGCNSVVEDRGRKHMPTVVRHKKTSV